MPANTEFPKPIHRDDPYRNFKFRLKWDGNYVAGVSKVSGLTRTSQVITHRAGGDPARRTPGRTEYDALTLERGITHDPAFQQWANQVWDYSNTGHRKDIVLELYNEAGKIVIAYTIYRCWVSEYQAVPELDASGNATAIQMLKLENEGWERDTSLPEPTEPDFTLPTG
jgi:phage tail-like protein